MGQWLFIWGAGTMFNAFHAPPGQHIQDVRAVTGGSGCAAACHHGPTGVNNHCNQSLNPSFGFHQCTGGLLYLQLADRGAASRFPCMGRDQHTLTRCGKVCTCCMRLSYGAAAAQCDTCSSLPVPGVQSTVCAARCQHAAYSCCTGCCPNDSQRQIPMTAEQLHAPSVALCYLKCRPHA